MAKRPREIHPNWISEHIPEELATSTLFRFDVKMPNGAVVQVDLLQDIDIDWENLESQLGYTHQQYLYYALMMTELKAQVSILERKCKARRGVLVEAAVGVAKELGVRPTADQTKSMIESDDTLNKLEAIQINSQKHANKLHHTVEALRMKSEHLRSLAGFKKQEREFQGRS